MASSLQQCKNVAQTLENEKAKLDEVMKDAKNNMQKYEFANTMSSDQTTAVALCEFRSGHGHQSRHYIRHSWTGNFMTRIPEFINSGDGATIAHKGSKGGLIYGLLPENPRSAAWLLAWSKSDDPSEPNRVYARGGTREQLVQSGIWSEVERELDQAGDYCQMYDRESGAVITARIRDDSDKLALVAASLSLENVPPTN
ncbi:hypothetical protein vseg_009656 [Gypsophila vaccaria]